MLPYRVKYLPDDSSDRLDDDLQILLETGGPFGKTLEFSQSPEEITVNWLRVLAASFKHSAFADEAEWRLCFQRYQEPMRNQRFRISKSTLIPYIAADLNLDSKKNPLVSGSYMKEVIVGPSASIELTKIAVEQMLVACGHSEVKVSLSAVPYRDW